MISVTASLQVLIEARAGSFNPYSILWYRGNEHKEMFGPADTDGRTRHYNERGPGWYFTTSKENAAQYGSNVKVVKLREPSRILTHNQRTNLRVIASLVKAAPSFEFNIQDWDTVGEGNPILGMKAFLKSVSNNMFDACQDAMVNFYKNDPEEFAAAMAKHFDAYITEALDNSIITGESGIRHMVVYNKAVVVPQSQFSIPNG